MRGLFGLVCAVALVLGASLFLAGEAKAHGGVQFQSIHSFAPQQVVVQRFVPQQVVVQQVHRVQPQRVIVQQQQHRAVIVQQVRPQQVVVQARGHHVGATNVIIQQRRGFFGRFR
jgi:hypothetical protein